MRTVIGIDIGSSSIKAVLFSSEMNELLHVERQPLRSRVSPAWFEEDPEIIRAQAFESIRSLTSFAIGYNHTIEAIAFSGQMHGGLVVDEKLQPLTHFITWQDKRSDEIHSNGQSYAEELRQYLSDDPTGVSIHTGFLITSLYWLLQNGGLPPNAAYVVGIYDWLTSLFVGRAVTDISSAAAWAMYDPVQKQWRTKLLQKVGLSSSLLPDVVEPGKFLGAIDPKLAAELSLPATTRIHASIGDTQASYLGAECKSDEVLLNFGTGSQSMWETKDPVTTPGTDIRYLQNERYLVTAPTLAGGEAIRVLADFFRDVVAEFTGTKLERTEVLGTIDRLAQRSGSERLAVDPIFAGSKFRMDGERGSITGIDTKNLRAATLARAHLEGMIEEIAWPYFERERTVRHSALVLAGSVMRKSSTLPEIASARFDLPARLAPFEEDAAVGAAKLCLERGTR
jgi:gluconokinase